MKRNSFLKACAALIAVPFIPLSKDAPLSVSPEVVTEPVFTAPKRTYQQAYTVTGTMRLALISKDVIVLDSIKGLIKNHILRSDHWVIKVASTWICDGPAGVCISYDLLDGRKPMEGDIAVTIGEAIA